MSGKQNFQSTGIMHLIFVLEYLGEFQRSIASECFGFPHTFDKSFQAITRIRILKQQQHLHSKKVKYWKCDNVVYFAFPGTQ